MNAGQNSLYTLRSKVLILCHNTRLICPHSQSPHRRPWLQPAPPRVDLLSPCFGVWEIKVLNRMWLLLTLMLTVTIELPSRSTIRRSSRRHSVNPTVTVSSLSMKERHVMNPRRMYAAFSLFDVCRSHYVISHLIFANINLCETRKV